MGFSQSRLSNQFLTVKDGGELLLFFACYLDLGIPLGLGHGRGICIIDAFIYVCNWGTIAKNEDCLLQNELGTILGHLL